MNETIPVIIYKLKPLLYNCKKSCFIHDEQINSLNDNDNREKWVFMLKVFLKNTFNMKIKV